MPYDQSWMGYGMVGALEAGGIAAAVGFLVFALLSRIGRSQGWNMAMELSWSYVVGMALAGGQDLWNLFYFNYGRLQSLQLLRIRLAAVHDADNLGQRVLFEFIGVGIGVYLGWLALGRRRPT